MERRELKAIVLFSGGFDSISLVEYIIHLNKYSSVKLLYFNYGNINRHAEYERADKYMEVLREKYPEVEIELEVLKLDAFSHLRGMQSTTMGGESTGDVGKDEYVPMRNLLFLSTASSYAEHYGVRDIYFGAIDNLGEYYSDTSPSFVRNINQLIGGMTGGNMQVLAPFVDMSKSDIALLMEDLIGKEGLDLIFNTAITCNVTSTKEPCMECEGCKEYERLINSFKPVAD